MTRNTDPTPATVQLVRRRDGHGCVCCGTSRDLTTQHRIARGMGGTLDARVNDPANLITLCGSGTTGCHGWVESHPIFSREAGWSLHSTDDPTTAPVLYPEGWFLLDDLGGRTPDPLTTRAAQGPRGHRGGSSRRWGEAIDGADVGGAWPPHEAGPRGEADPLRPWGSPRART